MSQPIDSRQLRAFLTLSRLGSFTETAKELNLTQSAISHAIRSLEKDLDCRLLYKSGKKILLSQEGKKLLQHAELILQEMTIARAEIDSIRNINKGSLRIGCSESTSQFILPTVLREFKDCFPEYQISVKPGDTPELIHLLEHNQIDLALAMKPENEKNFSSRTIFKDRLSYLVSPHHEWALKGKISSSTIAKQNYILYNRKSYSFKLIDQYFYERGIQITSFIELGSVEAIKELVKLGLGISILAPWVARKEISNGSLISLPLSKQGIRREWTAVTIRDKPLNLAEETFVGLCETVCKGL